MTPDEFDTVEDYDRDYRYVLIHGVVIVNPIPVPSQTAPGVPPAFDAWWAKAAARDPNLRFQSPKEFSDSLSLAFGVSQSTDVMERALPRPSYAGTPQPTGPTFNGAELAPRPPAK